MDKVFLQNSSFQINNSTVKVKRTNSCREDALALELGN